MLRCPDCKLLSADLPVAIPDEPGEGILDEAARARGLDALRHRNNALILGFLAGVRPATGAPRLLDVGCGPGFLLDQATTAGFAAEGIEPDANTLVAGRERGLSVRGGLFPTALRGDERFDVIVFNDVLEHIPDVATALRAAADHLTDGGVLCLNCPDQRGLFFRVASLLHRVGVRAPYERLWQKGLPSPHVWYFTPSLLRRAAGQAGLQPAGELRLATVDRDGLWSRIRMVKDTSLPTAVGTWLFTWLTAPLGRLFPSDATACFFRKMATQTAPVVGSTSSAPPVPFEVYRPGTYLHGTKAELAIGELLVAGRESNFEEGRTMNHVYFTATLDAAVWGAELASGDGRGRIYVVEPTGEFEDDPNLTDKRFPGNPTQSFRSREPLRVVDELTGWVGHPPEQLQAMRDGLDALRRDGAASIDD